MSLIQWEPFNEFDQLFRELAVPSSRVQRMGFDLAVDVYEDGPNLIAEMNLPGLSGKDIDIEVEDTHLRVSGSREEVEEKKEKSHYTKEIRRGSFQRVIPLPQPVAQKKVKAEYKDGVLKVVMPTSEDKKENKVKVQVK